MAKIRLEHDDVRIILENDKELFEEVKANILSTAIKGRVKVTFESIVRENIDNQVIELVNKELFELKNSRSVLNSYVTSVITEKIKVECDSLVHNEISRRKNELTKYIDSCMLNLQDTIEKRIDEIFNKFVEEFIKNKIEEKLKAIALSLS